MSEERISRSHINQDLEIFSGALVGLGVIAIVQMLSVERLDVPLKVSVSSFAVSIPSLSVVFLCTMAQSEYGVHLASEALERVFTGFILVGSLSSLIGISAVFFHFTTYAGIIFTAVSLVGLILWVLYYLDLQKRQETQA